MASLLGAATASRSLHGEESAIDPCVQPACSVYRPEDEVWLLSTRALTCCEIDDPAPNVLVWRHVPHVGWRPAGLGEFLGADPRLGSLFFLHGNRVDFAYSLHDAALAYGSMLRDTPAAPPFRYVIWSWPSDKVGGQLRDVRIKAERADLEAIFLARVLALRPAGSSLGFVAYSYGARITTGALHLSAGGTWLARTAPAPQPFSARVVCMAAALDRCWLAPGGCHDRALAQMECFTLLTNSCDPVLKRFRFLDPEGRPEALGYAGLPPQLAPHAPQLRIMQVDAAPYIGKSHGIEGYLCSAEIMGAAWRCAVAAHGQF